MNEYDAIVIGGGPGGSTAGTVMARAGRKVLILERENFPRFHIGESLIPYGNDVLREIGAWEKVERNGYMPKLGAEFVLGNADVALKVWFGDVLPPHHARTYQVERSCFDSLMLEHAVEAGCEVRRKAKAESISFQPDGVTVSYRQDGEMREARASWLFDATGRDALLGRQLSLAKSDLGFAKKIATFAHFTGVYRDEGPTAGNIIIIRIGAGWFWLIPLSCGKTSVGLVQDLDHFRKTGQTPEEAFNLAVESIREVRERMANATRVSDYFHASDYTYRHEQNAGPRWFLIGDAAGFIDPIFSSGVMLALKSGQLAAKEMLAAGDGPLTERAQRRYTREVGKMATAFLGLIKMFYDDHAFEIFMNPRPHEGIKMSLSQLIAGNTDPTLLMRWHLRLFYFFCRMQRYLQIAPRRRFDAVMPKAA